MLYSLNRDKIVGTLGSTVSMENSVDTKVPKAFPVGAVVRKGYNYPITDAMPK